MSTLMSRDLNIERPSTRLHAPPGGKSSFSLGGGWADEPVKKVVAPTPVPAVVDAVTVDETNVVAEDVQEQAVVSDSTQLPAAGTLPAKIVGMSSILSHDDQTTTAPVTARGSNATGPKDSMSNIINQVDSVDTVVKTTTSNKPVDTNGMSGILNQTTVPAAAAPVESVFRRVRQAPGGTSSIVIG